MDRRIQVIKAASDIGAGKKGAAHGPKTVLDTFEKNFPQKFGTFGISEVPITPEQEASERAYARNITALLPAMQELNQQVSGVLKTGNFPLILSGDHSNAIGAVSGFTDYFDKDNIGIIWIDAHLDLHSPYTTPSGNLHGMALNALIGLDNIDLKQNDPDAESIQYWEALKRLGRTDVFPKILPENIIFIGARDYEAQEIALAEETGMHVFTPTEINTIGIDKIIRIALNLLQDCSKIYVSFDVDSLDPSISAATGTPVPNGLTFDQAAALFTSLFHHPRVAAFEITEVNPALEEGNAMAETVAKLLDTVL